MKLNGNLIEARYEKVIQFNRSPNDPIVFTLQAFSDDELFKKLCPQPEPGWIQIPGQEAKVDTTSDSYNEKLHEWSSRQMDFMVVKAPKDIEWETVVEDDPETWKNWEQDMLNAGFSKGEVTRFHNLVFEVNGLTAESVTDAVKNL